MRRVSDSLSLFLWAITLNAAIVLLDIILYCIVLNIWPLLSKNVVGPHFSCSLLRMIFLLQFRTEKLWMEHTLTLLKDTDMHQKYWDWSHRVIAGDYFRVKGFLCGCLGADRAQFSLLQLHKGLFRSKCASIQTISVAEAQADFCLQNTIWQAVTVDQIRHV